MIAKVNNKFICIYRIHLVVHQIILQFIDINARIKYEKCCSTFWYQALSAVGIRDTIFVSCNL